MSRKARKNRTRSQGRKVDIVGPLPHEDELNEHATMIRTLVRQSFDDIVEIGRRLARCRELLKSERLWMAWLSMQFRWSRRTASRFIVLYKAKSEGKLGKLPTLGLPISAFYELATASPKLIQKIERDIEAGEQPSLRDIQQQARAERAVQIITGPTSPDRARGPRLNFTAPPEEPKTERRTLTAEDLERARVDHEAKWLPEEVARFAGYVTSLVSSPDALAAALPATERTLVSKDSDAIITFLDGLKRALWGWRPKVVGDGDDD